MTHPSAGACPALIRPAASIHLALVALWGLAALPVTAADGGAFKASTKLSLAGSTWQINGKKTYEGARAEGFLLNVKMANATFEDRNSATCPRGFDPDKNTATFVARIPEYVSEGIRAFGLSLQGASPGYAGALNSAYEADGALRPSYMSRVARAVEACDAAGAVVILTCFHQDQDQGLKDDDAVRKALVNVVAWIRERGYTNVCLEIANEHASKAYERAIIRDPTGIRELMAIAKKTIPDILVSASGLGGGRVAHEITVEADFVLLHFNNVPVEEILERVASADKVSKAIVCNEDVRTGAEGARALEAAVDAFCSWGFTNVKVNQNYPFRFEGAADDPVVYAKFLELATPERGK